MTMKRYLITGEARAVNTIADILSDDEGSYSDWLVAVDDGSSLTPLLAIVRGFRKFQKQTPCTIALCLPDFSPHPEVVDAWEGQRWECLESTTCQPGTFCYIHGDEDGINLLAAEPTWRASIQAALAGAQ